MTASGAIWPREHGKGRSQLKERCGSTWARWTSRLQTKKRAKMLSSRDHGTDFDVILVGERLVLGDQLVAADDEMRFDNEVQIAQQIPGLLRALNFNGPDGVT